MLRWALALLLVPTCASATEMLPPTVILKCTHDSGFDRTPTIIVNARGKTVTVTAKILPGAQDIELKLSIPIIEYDETIVKGSGTIDGQDYAVTVDRLTGEAGFARSKAGSAQWEMLTKSICKKADQVF